MDCRQINEHIFDYCDNSLSPELRQLVEEHVQGCELCQAKVNLTYLENEAIREPLDIPVLSPQFNSSLFERIENSKVKYPGQVELIPVPGRYNIRSILRIAGSLAAVLLLVLIWPSLLSQNNDTNENTRISEVAPDKQTKLYASKQSKSNNRDVNVNEPLAGQEESKLKAGSYPGTAEISETNKQEEENEVFYGKMPASVPTADQPQALTAVPQEAAGDNGVMFNFSTASRGITESPNPSNLPPEYQLVSSNNEGSTATYFFRKTDGSEDLNISISLVVRQNAVGTRGAGVQDQNEPVAPENQINENNKDSDEQITESKIAANDSNTTTIAVQKEISFNNQTYNLVISGNLPQEELTTIADSIILNKK